MNEHSDISTDTRLEGTSSHESIGSRSGAAESGSVAGAGAAGTAKATNRRRSSRRTSRKRVVDSAKAERVESNGSDRADGPQAQEPERSERSGMAANNGAGTAGPVLAKPRKKPVRRVFGRMNVTVGGERIRFELTKRGLETRRHHKRQVRVLTFGELANHTRQQALLFPNL